MRAQRRVLGAVPCLALALVVSPAAGTVDAVSERRPPFHPTRLTSVGAAQQVVVVTSGSWSSSRARLRADERQYRHAVVIDDNLPVAGRAADTRRGGGIFLHIDRPGATTGCVSIAEADLKAVLRWLDPAKAPVIVMAPRSAVSTS